MKAGLLLIGRQLPVSDVDRALIAEGLRLVAARLQAECAEAKQRGERSTTHEVLLDIINGDASGSKGLIARVTGGKEPLDVFDPCWEPIPPESSTDGTGP